MDEIASQARRRWTFSLRTMFVGVTLAALVAFWLAWYWSGPTIRVVGNLNRGDFAEILALLRQTRELQGAPFATITVESPVYVIVETYASDAPGSAFDKSATISRHAGSWSIECISPGE